LDVFRRNFSKNTVCLKMQYVCNKI